MENLCFFDLPLLGRCGIEERGGKISRLFLGAEADRAGQGRESTLLLVAAEQLAQYARGERTVFQLPLAPEGTAFQRQVWDLLLQIPYGDSRSYSQLAAELGRPSAARAVGSAVGANPIPVLIPCHRVLGKSGRLTGFRLGLPMKRDLLKLEGIPWKEH